MLAVRALWDIMRSMGANTGTGDTLAEYQRGSSFLLSTPQQTLLTDGAITEVPASTVGRDGAASSPSLSERAESALRRAREAGQAQPMQVGAGAVQVGERARAVGA